MKDRLRKTLSELMLIPGLSGHEDRVRRHIRARLEEHLGHAEALRLLERAEGLLEVEAEDVHQRSEAVRRARLILEKAHEAWPGSKRARTLLARARLEQADLALDRGDPRGALAFGEGLEPAGPVTADGLSDLRQAARRQRAPRRNQIAAVLVIGVAALGSYVVWHEQVAPEQLRAAAQA